MGKARFQYRALISFWAGITTEAVAGMLDNTRSGRASVQRQNQQDVLLRILPFLNEALAIERVPDLRVGCYMLMAVIASKGSLEDNVLATLMEAVAAGWKQETAKAALVCLSMMAQEREHTKLPKNVFRAIMTIDNLEEELSILGQQCRVDRLALGLVLGCIHQLGRTSDSRGLTFIKKVLGRPILDESQAATAVGAFLRIAQNFDMTSQNGTALQNQLADLLACLTDTTALGIITQKVIDNSGLDIENLETRLQIVLEAPNGAPDEPVIEDDVPHTESTAEEDTFEIAIKSIPTRTAYEVSFLSYSKSYVFGSLSRAFLMSVTSASNMETFTELPVLRKGLALSEPLYFTFFVRIWCGNYPVLARTAALQAVSGYFAGVDGSPVDVQALIPYILVALADSSTKVRRAASELLVQLAQLYKMMGEKSSGETKVWGVEDIYGQEKQTKGIKWLSIDDTSKIVEKMLLPGLEEFVLDSGHIRRSIEYALGGRSHSKQLGSKIAVEIKNSLRVSFLSFLSSHIISTPLYTVKLRLLTLLKGVEKVGTSSKTKALLPLLQLWISESDTNADQYCKTEGIDRTEMDSAVVAIVSSSDRDGVHVLRSLIKGDIGPSSSNIINAASDRIRTMWPAMKADLQLACAETLLELCLDASSDDASQRRQSIAADMLRNIPLTTMILLTMIDRLPSATANSGDKHPASKRRRTNNSEVAVINANNDIELATVRKITFVLELIDSSKPEKHPQLLQGLFHVLGELQLLRGQMNSDLAYLQSLCLGSLLAIMDSFKVCHGLTSVKSLRPICI